MPSTTSIDLPSDYARRVRTRQGSQGLTQAKFAELVGVSYATVNRWENRQSRPNNLAWARILELESSVDGAAPDLSPSEDVPPVTASTSPRTRTPFRQLPKPIDLPTGTCSTGHLRPRHR